MNVLIWFGAQPLVEAAGGNDRLTTAARQVRHRAAASLAERGGKAPSLGQIETDDGFMSPEPPQRRGLHDHLAGMCRPGGFSAARAVAVQEMIERCVDLESDVTAKAASAKR